MARLGEADLGRGTRFLVAARIGDVREPFPYWTLVELRDLIGADDAEYFELRWADRGVIAHRQTDVVEPDPDGDEALRQYGWQNPLSWRRWGPADGALRMSERIGQRALQRLEFWHDFLRPNGLTDVVKVWLHRSDASVACLQLWRFGGTFSARDEDLLAVLHHHLVRMRSEAVARGEIPASVRATLTRREAEVITWAVSGASDVEIAGRLGTSPATVGKHLENAFGALGVHSRAEAMWHLSRAAYSAEEPDAPRSGPGGSLDVG
jgi:DNA-binding CsgD family transcriptional regulator